MTPKITTQSSYNKGNRWTDFCIDARNKLPIQPPPKAKEKMVVLKQDKQPKGGNDASVIRSSV